MKALILAAGFGKRMLPYTEHLPKPLMKVAGHTLLTYTLFQLHRWGVSNIIINTHYLAKQIESFTKNIKGFEITISYEEKILGTAGALRKILNRLETPQERLILINPDMIFFADSPPSCQNKTNLWLHTKGKTSKEPGWMFSSPPKITMHRNGGDYYYLGCSTIQGSVIKDLPLNTFYELGPVWQQQARDGFVSGQLFEGTFIPVGNKIEYEKIKDIDPVPPELRTSFINFCKTANI